MKQHHYFSNSSGIKTEIKRLRMMRWISIIITCVFFVLLIAFVIYLGYNIQEHGLRGLIHSIWYGPHGR